MPLFRCQQCGCVENTALSRFWQRFVDEDFQKVDPPKPALCSECDPAIGVWHGRFPKRVWDAQAEANSGMPPGMVPSKETKTTNETKI